MYFEYSCDFIAFPVPEAHIPMFKSLNFRPERYVEKSSSVASHLSKINVKLSLTESLSQLLEQFLQRFIIFLC